MDTIKVRNLTALTDYSALVRAALYLAGKKDEAEEGGFAFQVTKSVVGTAIRVTENEAKKNA